MIKTGNEYKEDLKGLKTNVYMKGKKIENFWEDPRFQSTINLIAMNHDVCFEEKFRDLSVVNNEELIGQPVRRFAHHIQTTLDDSIKKVKLTREITQQRICGWCLSNTINILWATTYETDQQYNTDYHLRFQAFAKYLMENDYDCFWAMMDPKGDRTKKLSQQENQPGVRVVKKTDKGIVVRGAKVSTSYAACSKYIFVVPCGALSEEDKDFALAFATPTDAEGLTFVVRPAPERENPDHEMECPMGSAIGVVEGMTIFEDVFVPWKHVFMCGEHDMAQRVPYFFSNIHRQSKCACLAGHTDLVCGIAALVADVNGLDSNKISHIRDKLTHLMIQAEVAYGCALGSAVEGSLHPSGIYVPSTLIANAGLHHIKNLAGEHIQLMHDIAGGIIVTMPTEADYRNPRIKKWMDTYLAGSDKYTPEERIRTLYLAQEIAASKFTGYFLGWAINASGSPLTGEIFVRSEYDLQKRINTAKEWAKIQN